MSASLSTDGMTGMPATASPQPDQSQQATHSQRHLGVTPESLWVPLGKVTARMKSISRETVDLGALL